MNIWDMLLEQVLPPTTLVCTWTLENEPVFITDPYPFIPSEITTMFKGRGDKEDDLKFKHMRIKGKSTFHPGILVTHPIDKLTDVPIRFWRYTDRYYGQEADI